MTKKQLINALAPYSDDMDVCVDITDVNDEFAIHPVEHVAMSKVLFSEDPDHLGDEDTQALVETIVLSC